MSETKQGHTPGPWRLKPHEDGYCQIEAGRGYYTGPFEDTGFEVTGYTGGANARLIAAAPDLLAALEEIERRLSDEAVMVVRGSATYSSLAYIADIASAAIAKAKGEA